MQQDGYLGSDSSGSLIIATDNESSVLTPTLLGFLQFLTKVVFDKTVVNVSAQNLV